MSKKRGAISKVFWGYSRRVNRKAKKVEMIMAYFREIMMQPNPSFSHQIIFNFDLDFSIPFFDM